MRLLIAEQQHSAYAALLQQAEPALELCVGNTLTELSRHAAGCELWLGQPDLLAGLLRQGFKPRWLQSTWAGITPLLAADLPRDYCLSRAVGIFGQLMAEYLLTYMLAHERQLLVRVASQQQRQWDDQAPNRPLKNVGEAAETRQKQAKKRSLRVVNEHSEPVFNVVPATQVVFQRPVNGLAGRRVLLVGCGEIGNQVAQLLAPFGLQLFGIASSARAQAPFQQVLGLAQLAEQAAQADYLINLLPDTPGTADIFDAALFAQMKPSAVFINAGRGAAVVEADLLGALARGQLAGAVLDVCRSEPLPAEHPFWTAPHLLLTGHSAAPTLPAPMVELFLRNLRAYRAGTPLCGQVEFARGY